MTLLYAIFLLLTAPAYAHKGMNHKAAVKGETVAVNVTKKSAMEYDLEVKPIFSRSCINCHGTTNKLPWYYELPGVGSIMSGHIKESKTHLDLSQGYPFKGHGSLKKDLQEIKRVLEDNEMPPWYFRLMHSDAKITKKENIIIQNWVTESTKRLDAKELVP